jgi:hypothetical protein
LTDEKFVFISESKEKKNIAHSARNRRTHAGKGGKVRFPSDYLSKKELEQMNSEVTAYRLNEMMTWKEYKDMPDDIKITYINLIRKKFNAPSIRIAEAFGISKFTFLKEISRLGIGEGKGAGGKRIWDEEGFNEWCNRSRTEETEEDSCESESFVTEDNKEIGVVYHENLPEPVCERKSIVPCSGALTFKCEADAALKTVIDLLGNSGVNMTIRWTFLGEETDRDVV